MEHRDAEQRFLELLKPCHDRLARFARAMTKTREDAEDLVGDTLLVALERFEDLREPQAFLSWLFSIASRLQKRKRWRARLFERFSERGAPPEPADGRFAAPDALADTRLLYEALEKLPHKQREAFSLFEIAGFSLAEIQETQGGSLSSVKMRLVRARERLRELLGEERPQRAKGGGSATIHELPARDEFSQGRSQSHISDI